MKISNKDLEKIIREEISLEARRRVLLKKLNEVNISLGEYDSNLPTGIPDPGDSMPDPIISNYEINNGIVVYFSNYEPINIDLDSFVRFYEKVVGRHFPSNMSNEESMKVIMIENDDNVHEFIDKYVNAMDSSELIPISKDDYDEDMR